MKIRHFFLSLMIATTVSLGTALAALAKPAVLVGEEPGTRVNVRSAPSTESYSPHYGIVGDRVEVLNQTQGNDGYTWYYVKFASQAEGWVRGDFVRLINQVRYATLTGLEPGSRVNVRSAPSTDSDSPHYGLVGDRVRVLRQTEGSDGYLWYYVRFSSNAEGWVRGDFITLDE